MPGVTFGKKTIGGVAVPYAGFVLTEGQLEDGTPTSRIVDPGAVAQSTVVTPVPTINEWGMISLCLLMAGAALTAIRRKNRKSFLQ